MYGKDYYGLVQYAQEKIYEDIPDEYYVNLAQYAPQFLARVKEIQEIYAAQGYEMGILQYCVDDMRRQFFIQTATWGLANWENVFGITTNMALSYEDRREILLAKIRGQSTTTKEMIISTAATFSGGEVDIVEDCGNNRFIIRFIGIKGIPRNMNAFIEMLEEIKPAHLAYTFEYRYTTWNGIKSLDWNAVKLKTWDEIKIMKEV